MSQMIVNRPNLYRRLSLLGLLLVLAPLGWAQSDPGLLPGDSVYQLEADFSDQSGQTFQLTDRRGRPQLVAMFYTSCRYVCPLIVDSAKAIEHALGDEARAGLGILLVSLDPDRDDTAALKKVVDQRKLDPTRWTLARTSEHDVRALAALLGVRYRALADGEFNHTSSLVLLDDEGRKLASSTALGAKPDPEFLAAVRRALAESSPVPAP
jgi:protein SCO1/2